MGISALDISASGMSSQRLRMRIIANNLANVETTSANVTHQRGADGRVHQRHVPYSRKMVIFKPGVPGKSRKFGVSTPMVIDDPSDFRIEFNAEHPHAVKDPGADDFGRVYYPNVNPIVEMVDMISASRAYEANVTAIDVLKTMGQAAMSILA
ncbi:MAG: flagellar basal body rod protein FlgC [Planctomycetota bacterium]|jgi:flagellar basal-body rod protein FlgC